MDLVAVVRDLDTAGLHLADILVGIGGLVTASTGLVAGLQKIIPLLERLALRTSTEYDDQAIDKVGRGIDAVATGLHATRRLCERTSIIKPGR